MAEPIHSPAIQRLSAAIHYIPGSRLLYINNPKVACTNVKWAMVEAFAPEAAPGMTSFGAIHRRAETPFAKGPGLAQALRDRSFTVFSMVRHPRRRFVSAYFNKIHGPQHPTGPRILESIGLHPKRSHPPKAVLKGLLKLPTQDINGHVAPQVVNLFWGSIPYDRVFRLETLKGKSDPLIFDGFHLPMVDKSLHSTQGKTDLSLFDAEDYEMIDHLYQADYAAFGYQPDPAAPVSELVELPPFRPFLLDLLTAEKPLSVLKARFGIGPVGMIQQKLAAPPPDLTLLEAGAMLDCLFKLRRLDTLPPRLLQEVERQATATPENAARLHWLRAQLAGRQTDEVAG